MLSAFAMSASSQNAEPQAYFDSIASCCAALDLPKSLLRQAKRDGAPGFRGSRGYPFPVLVWLIKRDKPPGKTAEELDMEFRADRNALQKEEMERERGRF